jgi:Ca2+-binding EF-hand superfamily protein
MHTNVLKVVEAELIFVVQVVAECIPTEELEAIKELFHMLDTNKDGHLTIEELRNGLQTTGHNVQDTDVDMLMQAVRYILSSIIHILNHLIFLRIEYGH